MVKGSKFISFVDKCFKEKWFNFGYIVASFLLNQSLGNGFGWAMAFIYFAGCAFIDILSDTD